VVRERLLDYFYFFIILQQIDQLLCRTGAVHVHGY
jgi:hypothetical protein